MIVLSRFLGKFKTDSWFALPVLLFFSGDVKKSSENHQLTGHFQSFFIFFFVPPTLNLKNNSRK